MKIAPSVLAADFLILGEQLQKVEAAGADLIHLDIMDGNFVPNISIGFPVVESNRRGTILPLDVHLMIEHPLRYAQRFCDCGAWGITFHIECLDNIDETIEAIRRGGAHPALSLRPSTPVESLIPYLSKVDMVLVMAVEPGFGGQKFMPEMLDRIRWLKKMRPELTVEVDGGINVRTVRDCAEAGADICVSGSKVFRAEDIRAAVLELKAE